MMLSPLWIALLSMSLSGVVGPADIERLLDRQLPRTLGADSLHWSLSHAWAPVALPPGTTEVRLVLASGEPRPGVQSCALRLLTDGEVTRSVPFAARCERVGVGVRMRRAVRSGELLAAEDVEAVRAALPAGERPLASADEVAGWRMRRTLAEGAWLTAGCVERAPVVRTGGPLEVRAEAPALVIRFHAIAQQNGGTGDVIRARGPRGSSLVRVRVTGPGTGELVP